MPKIDVYSIDGKVVDTMELNSNVFEAEVNEVLVHDAVVNFLANQRQGTQSTKTRAEVRGGGAKPWKQKGTGRARQGSIRAPQWIKGGIALGPKPRSYTYKLPKKVKQSAFRSIFSSKFAENNLIIVDKLELKEIKTRLMVNTLNNLKATEKALIILSEKNLNVQASSRNIKGVKTTLTNTINVYDMLKYTKLIITKDAVKKIEEVYA